MNSKLVAEQYDDMNEEYRKQREKVWPEISSAVDRLKAFVNLGGFLGVGVKTQPVPFYGLGLETINPVHGSISEDRVMTYFCEPSFRDLLLLGSDFRLMGHITLPIRSLAYNNSWIFVKRNGVACQH